MAYKHGVYGSEIPTSIVAPVNTTAGLPVVFGTAPVHLVDNPIINKPVLCYEYAEAVKAFGFSDDWDSYTLCEAMYSEFNLYAVAPIVFVNVLDPAKHKKSVTQQQTEIPSDKIIVLDDPVIASSFRVFESTASQAAVAGTDYVAGYNDDDKFEITILADGSLNTATHIYLSYDAVDPTKVTSDDIIGGVGSDDSVTGLELLNQIYSLLGLVPGMVVAPKWSSKPDVAAVMSAKALSINSLFRCIVLTDIDTTVVKNYSAATAWKNNNNYTATNEVVCWPMYKLGEKIYHASVQLMGAIGVLDAANDDVPYQSPSNVPAQMNGACLADGTEVTLSLEQANYLNSQGICTALNFNGGWKHWGNYTGAYPSITDVKDTFICVRRMFDWDRTTFILTYWQKVDRPLNRRLVHTIVDSEAIRLNGLVARDFLLGASVSFDEDENPLTDLLQGIMRIHKKMTPPVPAQCIEEVQEYDVSNFNALFEEG